MISNRDKKIFDWTHNNYKHFSPIYTFDQAYKSRPENIDPILSKYAYNSAVLQELIHG